VDIAPAFPMAARLQRYFTDCLNPGSMQRFVLPAIAGVTEYLSVAR